MKVLRPVLAWSAAFSLCILAAGCTTATGSDSPKPGKKGRGITFSHATHAAAEIDCSSCHELEAGDKDWMTIPGHDTCSLCHEIPDDWTDTSSCAFCHSSPELELTEYVSVFDAEKKFAHDPHLTAGLECASCHADPDAGVRPKGGLKPMCMDCHGQTRAELNTCSVCHSEMSQETIPTQWAGVRMPHDAPEIWEKVHGQRAQMDAASCALCHGQEESCETCHRTQPPSNHTLSWRRKTHGMQATWNRSTCSVCHEEETCIKCHRNTEPASHRGSWGRPLNAHCANCHFPEHRTTCATCHEEINHPTALPSPHVLGLYPPNCGLCHPGGLPHRAPHMTNSTTQCVTCHR